MQHQTVPQTTGIIATIRALLAAGWRNDSVYQAGGNTCREMLHPSGREITARTSVYGDDTSLTMTGLTLDQVAGAINGAGLAPTEPTELPRADQPEPDPRQRLAAELHRIADDIVTQQLPLNPMLSARLSVGVLDSRADLDRWAAYLGSTVKTDPTNDIPSTSHKIQLDGKPVGADLTIQAQTRPEQPSELERLRSRVAELEAERAAGGAR